MRTVKRTLLPLLQLPGVPLLFSPLLRERATVFMLHRFDVPELGMTGHATEALRTLLAYLRRHRYEIVALSDLFRRLAGEGPPLRGAVAFTMDDGYFDQAAVAGPVFAEFDCPVTTFVTTGFLSGRLWMWWDRIEHVFRQTRRRELQVQLSDRPVSYQWQSSVERDAAQDDFTQRCKRVPDAEKHAAIDRLAAVAEVELPVRAPPRYAPMSWDQLRASETRGMSFGPHTVTHPVLTQATDEQSPREIGDSWKELQAEASKPVPVFCYPNGQETDFGAREIAAMRGAGLVGAVVGTAGYADKAAFAATDGPFRLKRFAYPESLPHAIQCVSGMERLKELLKGIA